MTIRGLDLVPASFAGLGMFRLVVRGSKAPGRGSAGQHGDRTPCLEWAMAGSLPVREWEGSWGGQLGREETPSEDRRQYDETLSEAKKDENRRQGRIVEADGSACKCS